MAKPPGLRMQKKKNEAIMQYKAAEGPQRKQRNTTVQGEHKLFIPGGTPLLDQLLTKLRSSRFIRQPISCRDTRGTRQEAATVQSPLWVCSDQKALSHGPRQRAIKTLVLT